MGFVQREIATTVDVKGISITGRDVLETQTKLLSSKGKDFPSNPLVSQKMAKTPILRHILEILKTLPELWSSASKLENTRAWKWDTVWPCS